MKHYAALLCSTFMMAQVAPAAAQLPPGLLGGDGSAGPLHSEPFYKNPADGMWVLMRNPENDGFKCSVNFFNQDQMLSIHGPWDDAMARKNAGMVWFDSKKIPNGPARPTPVPITLNSADGPQNVNALHVGMGGKGMLILFIDVKKMVKEKRDSDRISVTMNGQTVFDQSQVQFLNAYRRLDQCMQARRSR